MDETVVLEHNLIVLWWLNYRSGDDLMMDNVKQPNNTFSRIITEHAYCCSFLFTALLLYFYSLFFSTTKFNSASYGLNFEVFLIHFIADEQILILNVLFFTYLPGKLLIFWLFNASHWIWTQLLAPSQRHFCINGAILYINLLRDSRHFRYQMIWRFHLELCIGRNIDLVLKCWCFFLAPELFMRKKIHLL